MSFFSRFLWRGSSSSAGNPELRKLAVRDAPAGLKTLSGRFGVGFVDVEWEDSEGLGAVGVDNEEIGMLGNEMPFVLARIYYPAISDTTDPSSSSSASPSSSNGTWLPSSHYFPGYGYFLRLPSLVSSGIGRLLASNVRIHAQEYLPLITVSQANDKERLPVIIFSHGLAGIRTTYSTICCEMASRGIVVVALEHRDGSASMTIDQNGKVYPYRAGPSGLNSPMVDYQYRAAQSRHRIKEFLSTEKFIKSLDSAGDFDSLLQSTPSLTETLKHFKGRLLTDRLILMGHSFGGSTCLAAAQQIPSVSCCIVWDPWMFPLPQPFLPINRTDIDTLLIINEKFSWSENDAAIQKFVDYFRHTHKSFAKVRMIGCGHMDQSDLASIIPKKIIQILRPGSSSPANHHRVLQANIDLVSAHLSYAFPTFSFDSKFSMIDLASTENRQISPMLKPVSTETNLNEENEIQIDPIIKLETFINFKV